MIKCPMDWTIAQRFRYRLSPATWVGYHRNDDEEQAWKDAQDGMHPRDPTRPSACAAVGTLAGAFAKISLTILAEAQPEVSGGFAIQRLPRKRLLCSVDYSVVQCKLTQRKCRAAATSPAVAKGRMDLPADRFAFCVYNGIHVLRL